MRYDTVGQSALALFETLWCLAALRSSRINDCRLSSFSWLRAPIGFVPQHPFTINMLLRVAALQLIRTALDTFPTEFAVSPHQELFHEYVKLFFSSLTVKPVIVVEAAHAALSQVRFDDALIHRCSLSGFNSHEHQFI